MMQALLIALSIVPVVRATNHGSAVAGANYTTFKVFLSASSSSMCNRYRLKNATMFNTGECKAINGGLYLAIGPPSPQFYYKPSMASCTVDTAADGAVTTMAPMLEQYTDENCTMATGRYMNATQCSDYLKTTDETLSEQYLVECGFYSGAKQVGLTFFVMAMMVLAGIRGDA